MQEFARLLLKWNKRNNRTMPWKGEKNPYYIWLSEIILQQTRVEQGLPYFLRFKDKYPTVKHLAKAPEDEVMKMWQGLGYYSRARNLHHTAKLVHSSLKGKFPDSFIELRKLKGVGDYTAAAIASFAYGEKKAVVDGNVIRVLARIFGIVTPFATTAGKKEFARVAQELIPEENPAEYNQAIMDFGAIVCSPQNPLCTECCFAHICTAYRGGLTAALPYRENKTKVTSRYFTYLLIKTKTAVWVHKRSGKDIWNNLYELPLIETGKPLKRNMNQVVSEYLGCTDFVIEPDIEETTQLLSHRKIHFRFLKITLPVSASLAIKGAEKISFKKLSQLAFPRTIHLYLLKNSLL